MKQLFTVLKFEYLGILKGKAFAITTVLILLLCLVAGNIPRISKMFDSGADSDAQQEELIVSDNEANPSETKQKAIIIDEEEQMDNNMLTSFFPSYQWVTMSDAEAAKEAVKSDDYEFAVVISGDSFVMYSKGGSSIASSSNAEMFSSLLLSVKKADYLGSLGLTEQEIIDLDQINITYTNEYLTKDAGQSFFFGYALLFILYFAIMMYGQMITSSVATEKSTKTMEILVTNVKPKYLLFGKVFGTGFAGLTQFVLLMGTAAFTISINLEQWLGFSPNVGEVLKSVMSSNLLYMAILFFLLGFFAFGFIYAAFGSTITRLEEANTVIMLPMLLFVSVFLVSMSGLMTPNAGHIVVLSYVPFFSPMVMFMRMCVTDIGIIDVLLAIVINALTVVGAGIFAARIYRTSVMMYGNAPNLKTIIKYFIKG